MISFLMPDDRLLLSKPFPGTVFHVVLFMNLVKQPGVFIDFIVKHTEDDKVGTVAAMPRCEK